MTSQSVDPEELGKKCEHDRCHCVPDPASAVVEGKSVYCSVGCRDGSGCSCSGCECAQVS